MALAGLLAGAGCTAASAQSIFTCIDAQGRRLTSDRLIPECLDREQRELGPSGMVRRVVPPSSTAQEREAEQQRRAGEAQARDRARETLRRDQMLVMRYPHPAAHDAERQAALRQCQENQAFARQRLDQLQDQRKDLDEALAAADGDPARVPPGLRRELDDNTAAQAAQQRTMDAQAAEQQRIEARFDTELAYLRGLWAAAGSGSGNGAASPGGPYR